MNKKKLPKVIVCRNDEAHPPSSPSGSATAEPHGPADCSSMRNTVVSGLPLQAADNVVQMISPAASVSPDHASKVSDPPQLAVNNARRQSKAQAIVNRYAAYSAIGGLVPLALANFAGITTIILRMVKVLCKHYGVPFEDDRARAIVIALVGGAIPTGAAAITTSTLLYIVPPAAVLGVAVCSVTAGVFTRSVGRVFIEHFEGGASLDTLSAS